MKVPKILIFLIFGKYWATAKRAKFIFILILVCTFLTQEFFDFWRENPNSLRFFISNLSSKNIILQNCERSELDSFSTWSYLNFRDLLKLFFGAKIQTHLWLFFISHAILKVPAGAIKKQVPELLDLNILRVSRILYALEIQRKTAANC